MRADAATNRLRILDATLEAVALDGTGVPASEIAERAGVGVSTLYRHFPDRYALLASCSVWGWHRIDGLIARRLAAPPSRLGVRSVLTEVAAIVIDGATYLEATGERIGRTPVEVVPVKAVAEARFARVLDRAARAGEVTPHADAGGLLDLTMTIREERGARERLDLLARALLPGPDGR